jgi:hypothetical protein
LTSIGKFRKLKNAIPNKTRLPFFRYWSKKSPNFDFVILFFKSHLTTTLVHPVALHEHVHPSILPPLLQLPPIFLPSASLPGVDMMAPSQHVSIIETAAAATSFLRSQLTPQRDQDRQTRLSICKCLLWHRFLPWNHFLTPPTTTPSWTLLKSVPKSLHMTHLMINDT